MMLAEKIYKHSNEEYFQLNLFRNIFYTAVYLREYEWTFKFIEDHVQELQPEFRENIKHLAYAYINFGKCEFETALEEITKVRYDYFAFKFDVRLLTLKIYYEMNLFEPALSLIDSFSHFLSNNKNVSVQQKESFGNFLKFLKQLVRIKSNDLIKDSIELKREINSVKTVISKNWLLEKVSELE